MTVSLLDAIRIGDLSAIRVYGQANSLDVNINGYSPLTLAAFEGRVRVVKLLLELGADPNFSTSNGWTPIIAAANDGRTQIVKVLLKAGANPNSSDSRGRTALHHLCFCPRKTTVEIARILISSGADSNLKDANGQTPYQLALSKPSGSLASSELIQLLKPQH